MLLAGKTLLFVVTEDWYFRSHRLPIAQAARDAGAQVTVACRIGSDGPDHAAAIKAEGISLIPLNIARSGRNLLSDLKLLFSLISLYRSLRPDIVHHVAIKPVLYGSIAAWVTGIPVCINALAGLGFLFISNGTFARLIRPPVRFLFKALMNRKRAHLIVQNPDDKALFHDKIGVEKTQISIIRGSGVDCNAFAPPLSRSKGKDILTAICVSRMLWDKGIGELVEAARQLKTEGGKIKIRLVGPTDENPASIPQATLDAWQTEGTVEVVGASGQIAEENAAADIAVLPSYREGLPKSLLEAAACGLPLVATDVPGCREICRDEETGLLVPPRSIAPLANALKRLAEDSDLRDRLGKTARRVALEEFSTPRIQKETIALYEAMVNRENNRL